MMHGLEARAPFLDIDLVDFVRRIPAAWKFRNGETKYLLKKALEPILPRAVIYRKKKGFGVPIGAWFSDGQLAVDPKGRLFGLDESFVERKLADHLSHKADQRAFLWNFWLIQKWGARSRWS
jgi:asparagine synthase (glutamine-hydrolysing)